MKKDTEKGHCPLTETAVLFLVESKITAGNTLSVLQQKPQRAGEAVEWCAVTAGLTGAVAG